jgi:hypothetical protein
MKIRVLRSDEYEILKRFPDGIVPDPQASLTVIAEDDAGELAGRLMVFIVPHVEGPFIFPKYRNGLLLRRMEEKILESARSWGLKKLFAFAADEQMEDYCNRSGWRKVPFTVWEKEI